MNKPTTLEETKKQKNTAMHGKNIKIYCQTTKGGL